MKGGVKHDDGEGEDEAGVPLLKDVGVLSAVVGRKRVHHSVDLHRLPWKPKHEGLGTVTRSEVGVLAT